MTPHSLDWEEGYRAGIERCLMQMMLNTKSERELWYSLAQMHEDSVVRSDRILRRMEKEFR